VNEPSGFETVDPAPDDEPADYKQARIWYLIVNGLAFAAFIGGVVWADHYQAVIWTMIALPILPVYVLHRFDGIIKLTATRGRGGQASVGLGLVAPAFILAMHGFADWDVLNWDDFWLPCAFFSLALAALLITYVKEMRRDAAGAVMCYICCAAYGYGAALDVNGMLATGAATPYPARIAGQYTEPGKNYQTNYFFTLAPWGPRLVDTRVPVSKSEYDHHAIGDTVNEWVRVGELGIPCYFMREPAGKGRILIENGTPNTRG